MIEFQQVSFKYNDKGSLFNGLSMTLPPGFIYGLLGKNGAGKSTLLKIIAGLLFPKTGNVHVAGFVPRHRDPGFLNEIYLISEEFHVPALTIDQYLKIYSPFYPRFSHEQFETYIKEFNLDPGHKLSGPSYGQKKNFLLSFGLATDCKLLILDEPTNGLDIPSKSLFRKIVANAIHSDRTFIISTHQVRDMENLIDPIIILDEGKLIFFENYENISRKLAMSRQAKLPDRATVIYSESNLGGYSVVEENLNMEETRISLELLFNAVTANPIHMNKVFNTPAS